MSASSHSIIRTLTTLLIAISLTGCASVKSANWSEDNKGGIQYWLPKKDVKVTLVVDTTTATRAISVEAGTAYPDLRARYLARFAPSQVAENTLNITVGVNGLLQSSKTETVSKVNEILSSLAKAAGMATAFAGPAGATRSCALSGTSCCLSFRCYPVPQVKIVPDLAASAEGRPWSAKTSRLAASARHAFTLR